MEIIETETHKNVQSTAVFPAKLSGILEPKDKVLLRLLSSACFRSRAEYGKKSVKERKTLRRREWG
jgi:hypothetical protein